MGCWWEEKLAKPSWEKLHRSKNYSAEATLLGLSEVLS
jgi:hypothetical protein